jgi:hypothetical protein
MVNAGEDHVVPRECTEKLARAAGVEDRVIWLEGLGHYTAMASLPRLLDMTTTFFGKDMPPGCRAATPAARTATPVEALTTILRDAVTILGGPVKAGRCHLLDCEIKCTRNFLGGFKGRVRFVRDSTGRFELDCPVPEVGRVCAGQSDTIWFGGGKVVFMGTKEALAGRSPLLFVNMRNMLKIRVAMGAVAGLAAAPDAFAQYAKVTRRNEADQPPALLVTSLFKGARGEGVVELASDGRSPRRILLGKNGELGQIVVRQWLLDTIANDALFCPPAGLRQQPVRQEDVCRMLAAIFDFAMERF